MSFTMHMTLQIAGGWVVTWSNAYSPRGAHKHQLVMSYLHPIIICESFVCACVCVHTHTYVHTFQTHIQVDIATYNAHTHAHVHIATHISHMYACVHAHAATE